jgi:hypothetical protein
MPEWAFWRSRRRRYYPKHSAGPMEIDPRLAERLEKLREREERD